MKASIANLILMLILGVVHIQIATAESLPNAESSNRLGARWFVQDQQKCDAAMAELPQALAQVRNIRIAGFSTEPVACVSQELLNTCKIKFAFGDADYYDRYYDDLKINCELGNSDSPMNVELTAFTTFNNGLVITRLSYTTPLGEGSEDSVQEFLPSDAAYRNLISRYGEPIYFEFAGDTYKFKEAAKPYHRLVWAKGAVTHFAEKFRKGIRNGRLYRTAELHIQLEVNLSPDFYGKFIRPFVERQEAKKIEAANNAPGPKF